MIVSKLGCSHYSGGINNQDFYYSEDILKMVLDGCSEAKYSEIGTRLFTQLFSTLPDRLKLERFESNIKITFDNLLEKLKFWYPDQKSLDDFIIDNLLFTILACFETEDSFVVKMFGDGYIVTVNQYDRVSYLRHFYGKEPPYFAYKYCGFYGQSKFKDYEFKTFTFSKKVFKKVGIASDGISPIAKGEIKANFDDIIVSPLNSQYSAEGIILANIQLFNDDVTILI